jgi:16S rRNA (adenine(1408)-N(1))-methyltransferase
VNVIQGKKTSYMTRERLDPLLAQYEGVTVDVGAGDGLWALEQALKRPERLFIAIDSQRSGLAFASAKAAKNPARGGAPNAIFVAASIRQMPRTLARVADEVLVTLPTGNLALGILLGDEQVAGGLAILGRKGARIKIVLNKQLGGTEAGRRLPDVTPLYTRDIIAPPLAAKGVRVSKARWMTPEEVAKLDTTWSKKIAHLPNARTFYIEAKVIAESFTP